MSGDRFVETTRTGWGSRLLGSVAGVLVGLLLVIGSIALLAWNEGRAVTAATALAQGRDAAREAAADRIDPALDGHLVHITGRLAAVTPARDPLFAQGGDETLRLRRIVEMYQWLESKSSRTENNLGGSETTETVYEYRRDWSEQAQDSSGFRQPEGHRNPAMTLSSQDFDGTAALAGPEGTAPRTLAARLLDELDTFDPLAVAPDTPGPNGYRAADGGFYRGRDPQAPEVGDLRVRFEAATAQTVSIVARQAGTRLEPHRTDNGYEIALLSAGEASSDEMFREAEAGEQFLTWLLRAAGFVLMLVGFLLMFRPLAVLAGVVPALETVVGAGAFLASLVLAIPLTLIVIAIAWLAYRPLLAIGLLVAAGGAFYGLWRRAAARRAGSKPAAA